MSNTDTANSIDYWERFAEEHPEGPNVNPGVARPNIDHGRLLTIQRREKFATLTAELESDFGHKVQIPHEAILSPRRINRAYLARFPEAGDSHTSLRSIANFSAAVAEKLYYLLRDWRDDGFPELAGGYTARVSLWTVTLKGAGL